MAHTQILTNVHTLICISFFIVKCLVIKYKIHKTKHDTKWEIKTWEGQQHEGTCVLFVFFFFFAERTETLEMSMSRYCIYLAPAIISSLICCCYMVGLQFKWVLSKAKARCYLIVQQTGVGGLIYIHAYMVKAKSFTYGGLYCWYVIFDDKDGGNDDETLNGNAQIVETMWVYARVYA